MSQESAKRIRQRQEIAAEAAQETDTKRLLQLAQELVRALDEKNVGLNLDPVKGKIQESQRYSRSCWREP